VATLHVENFPGGLYHLLEKLAAADGITLHLLLIRLVHEHLYGFPVGHVPAGEVLPAARPNPPVNGVITLSVGGNAQAETQAVNTRAQRA
jgi:hypothetical protein